MNPFLRRLLFWSLMLVLHSSPARATTFVLTDTADLFHASSVVVLGRVEAIRSVENSREIRTNIDVRVEEVLKGPTVARINIVEPGGAVRQRRRWIYGAPTFFVGERVLLFLRRNVRDQLETASLAMGKFTVARSRSGTEFAIRNLDDARVLTAHGRKFHAASSVTTHVLHEFLATLRSWGAASPPAAFSTELAPPAEGSRWQAHFVFAGPPLMRWFLPDQGEAIRYQVSADGDAALGDAAFQAVHAALGAWSTTGCTSLNLLDAGTTAAAPFGRCDGVTEIAFNDPFSEIADPIGCSGILALGGVCADSQAEDFNGTPFYPITEGDVMVNNGFGDCPFWTPTNLAEMLTHEIGHTLGLAHSSENPNEPDPTLRNATMYYTAHFDGRGATLMSDDIAGICALYPAGRQGAVTLRRFAMVSGAPGPVPSDRLLMDGTLTLDNGNFDPATDTLIIAVQAAGTSVFRVTVLPGDWISNPSGTRLVYHGVNASGTTTVILVLGDSGSLRFRLHARGLDLSGAARTDPITMVLALGGANVTDTVPPLRTSAGSRVYP